MRMMSFCCSAPTATSSARHRSRRLCIARVNATSTAHTAMDSSSRVLVAAPGGRPSPVAQVVGKACFALSNAFWSRVVAKGRCHIGCGAGGTRRGAACTNLSGATGSGGRRSRVSKRAIPTLALGFSSIIAERRVRTREGHFPSRKRARPCSSAASRARKAWAKRSEPCTSMGPALEAPAKCGNDIAS